MDSDRELLELAAKAAGIAIEGVVESGVDAGRAVKINGTWWAPLHDDGDALRLAVNLRIDILMLDYIVDAQCGYVMCHEPWDGDPYAATRRAIVRAAAEIGRSHG